MMSYSASGPLDVRQSGAEGIEQEDAMDQLRERYARGGLPLDEFRQLMGALMVTNDPRECQAILDRLPPESVEPRSFSARRVSRDGERNARAHTITATFGSVNRSGAPWTLGPETVVNATFGEATLDVRLARLNDGENVLRLNARFGEISVVVPEGLHVEIESAALFGEVSVPGHSAGGVSSHEHFALVEGATSQKWLRIVASATFGEVSIRAR